MEVTESELFGGEKSDSVWIEEDSMLELNLTYTIDEDKRETPNIPPTISILIERAEESDSYVAKANNCDIRAICHNPLRAIAELIEYAKEAYHYTSYHYETYTENSEVEQVRVYQNEEVLFTIGTLEDSKEQYTINSHDFSYEFFAGLYKTERDVVGRIEKLGSKMLPMEGLRVPVKKDMDSIEKDILVQINKYILEFYSNNNVLHEDTDLHKMYGFASRATNHATDISTLTLRYTSD